MRVLAIVPAYNEAETVGDVVRELSGLGGVDVVVVDDGSVDDTGSLAADAGARVLTHPYNLGIGATVQTGLQYARDGGWDVAVQVDGDGQHPPAEIARIVEPIERGEADLVLGSRYAGEGDYRASPMRRLGMLILSGMVFLTTGRRFRDTTSGFRASGRAAIEYLAEHYPPDYPEVEALVLLHRAGFRIAEVGCRFRERQGGRSSITPAAAGYYMVKVLLATILGRFRRVPPRPDDAFRGV